MGTWRTDRQQLVTARNGNMAHWQTAISDS